MQINTKRLTLREFTAEDWPAVLAYQSDERYQRFYPEAEHNAAQARQFVQMFLNQQTARPRLKFQLAVTLKETGELIGNCGVRKTTEQAQQADIGYELSPAHWGKGYATEAAAAIVNFGFQTLNLHRIWAECIAENHGSARVLEKIGMTQEGQLRENQHFRGRWWDTLIYAVLVREWSQIDLA